MSSVISARNTLLKERVPNIQRMLFALALSIISSTSLANPPTAKDTISDLFWGALYKDGGETFYCQKSFSQKTPLIVAGYIYPQGNIRQHLGCGTKRQCMRSSEEYNRIASDLHNLVPADSYFEMKRTNTIFGVLDEQIEANECGIKRKMNIIEPPERIRGDIARVIFYMHKTYNLPILGGPAILEAWNDMDPPSEEEVARHNEIEKLQGNINPLVKSPVKPVSRMTDAKISSIN